MDADPLEKLRRILVTGRVSHGLTQESAAEAAGISVDRWVNLERGTRRTAVRLPADRDLIDGAARAIGRESGEELMREAGLL